MSRKIKSQDTVDRWNEKYPVGTPVKVRRDNGDILETVTRSIAWEMCGAVVVMVKGISGGYDIERVTPNTTCTGIAAGSDKPVLSASESSPVSSVGSPALR